MVSLSGSPLNDTKIIGFMSTLPVIKHGEFVLDTAKEALKRGNRYVSTISRRTVSLILVAAGARATQ